MIRWLRRLAVAAAVYLAGLLVLGWVAGGCVEDRVRARLAESMDAEVSVKDVSVDLLRGKVSLRGIRIVRDKGGHMTVDIDRVDVDVAAVGLVAVLRDPDRVRVKGARIALSALALRKRPPKPPINIGALEVEDVNIAVMATSYLPRVGRLAFHIDHGRTRRMELRSALSWVFYLEALTADVKLPVGSTVGLGYAKQRLSLRGSVFGTKPISVDFPLPKPNPDALEAEQIKSLAKSLAKVLVTKAGPAILKRKLHDAWKTVKNL